MRKTVNKLSLSFVLAAVLAGTVPSYAEVETSALKLEQALMKYILCYEAYIDAKQSDNPETRAQLGQFMKAYRESYAQYLALLHDADLYNPDEKANNPAGHYNQKQIAKGGYGRVWLPVSSKAKREQIKDLINQGKSIEEIMNTVEGSIPCSTSSASDVPDDAYDWTDGQVMGGNGYNYDGNGSKDDNAIFNSPTSNYGDDDDDYQNQGYLRKQTNGSSSGSSSSSSNGSQQSIYNKKELRKGSGNNNGIGGGYGGGRTANFGGGGPRPSAMKQ